VLLVMEQMTLALKVAHVGLSMGIQGSQIAKEASDIIIMDDSFTSIVKSVIWGRTVYDNVCKFLQFQLTVNVVALSLCFGAACFSGTLPLKPVQLLWVNLIMDTLAALALSTESPTEEVLNRMPYGAERPLISTRMWVFILCHAAYQLVILGIMEATIDIDGNADLKNTVVFNTFVFMQVFNQINARKVNGEFWVFDRITENSYFIMIWIFEVVVQTLVAATPGCKAMGCEALHFNEYGEYWIFSICVGMSELLWNFLPWSINTLLVETEKPKEIGEFFPKHGQTSAEIPDLEETNPLF